MVFFILCNKRDQYRSERLSSRRHKIPTEPEKFNILVVAQHAWQTTLIHDPLEEKDAEDY
jgi:hypothetical protein